jgi:HEAT repeat protein
MSISEILKQLPETDRELQAKLPPPENPEEQKRRRQQQLPESWGNASKFTGPDPTLARKLVAEVFAGGRKTILELIALLNNPADYKPEYLLHCMAVFAAGKEQKLLAQAIASQLEKSRARPILLRELQWIGSADAVRALGKFLADEKLCADAAAALTAIGGSAAASEFRKAFPKSAGKCRVIIAQNLGALRDAKSLDLLRSALQDSDSDLRLTAGWALAWIGDSQSVDVLMKIADTSHGYTRVKATNNVLLLAETLAGQGKRTEAARVYTHIQNTRTDPTEKYLRETAARHLEVFML